MPRPRPAKQPIPPASPSLADTREGGIERWIPLLIAAITVLAMARICGNEFVLWDDGRTLGKNFRLNPPTLAGVGYYWRHGFMGLYTPLTYTVWGLLAKVGRTETPDLMGYTLNPFVFHTASVMFHVLSALVVYALLKRTVKQAWAAAAGAVLFAIHPLQVEPVAWASGMKDVLCGLCALTALWQYFQFAQRDGEAPELKKRRALHYSLGMLALLLAMLSKTAAVATPIMAFVLDVGIVGRPWQKSVRSLLPWVALTLPFMVIAKMVQPSPGFVGGPIWARPLIAGYTLTFYLFKLVWPEYLAVDYGRRPFLLLQGHAVYIAWIVPAAIIALLWIRRRTSRPLVVAAALFVAGFLPVLGLVPFGFQYFSTVADHYLYFAMLGPALALAWLLTVRQERAIAAIVAIILLAFAARTYLQTGYWQETEPLLWHVIARNPESFAASDNLAILLEYRGDAAARDGDTPRAQAIYAQAEALYARAAQQSHTGKINDDYALFLFKHGRDEEAIEQIRLELTQRDRWPGAELKERWQINLALAAALIHMGRAGEAMQYLHDADHEKPGDPMVQMLMQQATSQPTTTPAH